MENLAANGFSLLTHPGSSSHAQMEQRTAEL
jgi:hypothetical protein